MQNWQLQAKQSEEALQDFIYKIFIKAAANFTEVKPATLWHRRAKDKKGNEFWDFNHLEDGHCPNDFPTPKFDNQKLAWKGGKWVKTHVYLDSRNKVLDRINPLLKETS